MKKLLRVIVMVLFIVSSEIYTNAAIPPPDKYYDFSIDNIYYLITSDSTVCVSKAGENKIVVDEDVVSDSVYNYSGEILIPSEVMHDSIIYKVTAIGLAWGNSAIQPFEDCVDITSVSLPNTLEKILPRAFKGCTGLKTIQLPNSLISIDYLAFANCSNIESITIPSSVVSIYSNAFSGCTALSEIIVDSQNSVYDSRDNCNAIIETSTNTLVIGCKNTIIPNSVTIIGSNAFAGCTDLSSIAIPDSVTEIGGYAFKGCSSLTSIILPNSITTIEDELFSDCCALVSIVIGDSVTAIGKSAFCNCESLRFLNLPNSITQIGNYAFEGCKSLSSVAIPNSVTKINHSTFYNCSELTSVVIPASVSEINGRGLLSTNPPSYGAFEGCANIIFVTSLNPIPPTCNKYVFEDSVYLKATLYVPIGSLESYANADIWKNFSNIAELPDAGIGDIETPYATKVARYDLHGRLLTDPTPGINIVIYSDGTTRKEFVK